MPTKTTLPKNLPTAAERRLAGTSRRRLEQALKAGKVVRVISARHQKRTRLISRPVKEGTRLPGKKRRPKKAATRVPETIEIPGQAFRLLHEILAEISKGNAVTVVPIRSELTTQQAADLLGVSRPFVVKQMDEGRLPHHKVGTHRRVRYADLIAFRRELRDEGQQALADLEQLDRDLDLI